MGRPCRVCNHEHAADIGRDLLQQTFCITVCPNIIDDQDDPFMKYVIDLDPVHQVLRVTVTGTLTDPASREMYASFSHFAAAGGPYAGILDLSGVTGNKRFHCEVRIGQH